MNHLSSQQSESHSEAEAAAILGISIERLHQLLDRHVFNQGHIRPPGIQLSDSDLLLLRYWNQAANPPRARILKMPKRSQR